MPKAALVFVNSRASQAGDNYTLVAERLGASGFTVEKGEARTAEDYGRIIRERRGTLDVVVLGGGDGTLQCAAEALMETKIPMGIIPLGTANNVARSLGIPLTIEGACDTIANGRLAPMDLGRVNGRIFVSVVGMGFSTDVHDEVADEHKKRWGSLSYALQALKLAGRPRKHFHAEIDCDGNLSRVRALQVTVCNGRYYGGHVEVRPEASLEDGLLDLSVIEAENFVMGFLKALLPIVPARGSKGLRLTRAKRIAIRTRPVRKLDVEGATDLSTPAEFTVIPAALRVWVPNAPVPA